MIGLAGAAVLGACTRASPDRRTPDETAPTDLLFVATASGLTAIDARTGRATLPSPAALATADWTRVVSTQFDMAGTRVTTRDPRSGEVVSGGVLRGRLEPRVVSPDGRLVALASPGGTPYRPVGRERTTIAVMDSGGERTRWDVAGNLEPEAFTPRGERLYVLEYLPPTRPDRYRVRVLNLDTGKTEPLQTRFKVHLPAGAEEEMRGEGRQAVFDAGRKVLFTLYTHQPDHLHTRDLLNGVRPGSPHVHAFVHSLSVEQGWAYCIDLPAPFGEGPAAGHAIALGPNARRLYVLDAGSGSLAHIDPEELTVERVTRFADPGLPSDAAAAAAADGTLVVGAGSRVVSVPLTATAGKPKLDLSTGSPVRGLALDAGGKRVYVGQDAAVVSYDLATGRDVGRVAAPGLVSLRHVSIGRAGGTG